MAGFGYSFSYTGHLKKGNIRYACSPYRRNAGRYSRLDISE
jgi:hypothetical protein